MLVKKLGKDHQVGKRKQGSNRRARSRAFFLWPIMTKISEFLLSRKLLLPISSSPPIKETSKSTCLTKLCVN